MITWKDNTTYAQSDIERVPSNWIAHINGHSIIVVQRWDEPGVWFVKSSLGVERRLGKLSSEQAKNAALEIIGRVLKLEIKKNQEFLTALESAKGE
jgi:hypothetical protein